jgi:putative RecB family exonuclease
MWEEDPPNRTRDAALAKLDVAVPEVLDSDAYSALALSQAQRADFVDDAVKLIDNYFRLEDPNKVRVLGTELRMAAQVGSLRLSGIIDRLELDGDELVVTDYKTGRAPSANFEQSKLGGVHFYAFLCHAVLGRRPDRVQLLHLREPLAITATPSEQSIVALERQTGALWSAVVAACNREDFRPKPGRLCSYCSYREFCPAVGGDLALLPARQARPAATNPIPHL